MSAQIHLFGLSYSPWSTQARWALDHHIIRYRYTEHVPLITNVQLRLAAKNFTGKLTVPLLVTDTRVFDDSWHIVNYADRTGHREKLIPLDKADQIRAWHDLSDAANKANRIIATDATSHNEAAKRAALPDFIPEFAKDTLTPLADMAAAYLSIKYDFRHAIVAEEKRKVREALTKVRQALKGKNFIYDTFTYADITASGPLAFVSPVADKYIPLKPALREAFTQKDLATEFADLVEWRDKLYADKRGMPHSR
ncbi:MAG TPA: glutathione S-transferase N-terminal domain-containing protein [Turneriella sp.]|nr:glutathione S-transferase N-terminal domain-containing protein [Turneriella sp.]